MKDIPSIEKRLIDSAKTFGHPREVRDFIRNLLRFIDPEEDWDQVIFGNKTRVYPIEEKQSGSFTQLEPVTDARA